MNITTTQMMIQRISILTPPLPLDNSAPQIRQALQTSQARSAMGKPYPRLQFEESKSRQRDQRARDEFRPMTTLRTGRHVAENSNNGDPDTVVASVYSLRC